MVLASDEMNFTLTERVLCIQMSQEEAQTKNWKLKFKNHQ